MQYVFEGIEELVGLGLGETKGRKEAQHVCAGTSGKDVALGEQARADFLVGDIEFDADHQAAAAHVNDMWETVVLHGLQSVNEVGSHACGIIYKMLCLNDIEYGERSSTGQMVAAKGRAELAIDGFEHGADKHTTAGKTVGNALGYGDEIGPHAEMLMGKESSAAAVATLDLIADEDGAVGIAEHAEGLQETGGGHADAADALYALDDDRADIAFLYLCGPRLDVVEGEIGDVAIGIDGGDDLGVGGGFDGKGGAAVEGFFGTEYARAPVIERGEFEGIFVGFGTAVDHKELVVVVAADATKALGELHLKGIFHAVAVETEALKLVGHALHIVGMAVADADDGMAAVEVKIFLTVGVPDVATLAALDGDIEEGIYVVEVHGS